MPANFHCCTAKWKSHDALYQCLLPLPLRPASITLPADFSTLRQNQSPHASPWYWLHLHIPVTLLCLESTPFCPSSDNSDNPDEPGVSEHHPGSGMLSYHWKMSLYWFPHDPRQASAQWHLLTRQNSSGYKFLMPHMFRSDSSNYHTDRLTLHRPLISGCTWNRFWGFLRPLRQVHSHHTTPALLQNCACMLRTMRALPLR